MNVTSMHLHKLMVCFFTNLQVRYCSLLGLARTIYIQCMYFFHGREINKCKVIYGTGQYAISAFVLLVVECMVCLIKGWSVINKSASALIIEL